MGSFDVGKVRLDLLLGLSKRISSRGPYFKHGSGVEVGVRWNLSRALDHFGKARRLTVSTWIRSGAPGAWPTKSAVSLRQARGRRPEHRSQSSSLRIIVWQISRHLITHMPSRQQSNSSDLPSPQTRQVRRPPSAEPSSSVRTGRTDVPSSSDFQSRANADREAYWHRSRSPRSSARIDRLRLAVVGGRARPSRPRRRRCPRYIRPLSVRRAARSSVRPASAGTCLASRLLRGRFRKRVGGERRRMDVRRRLSSLLRRVGRRAQSGGVDFGVLHEVAAYYSKLTAGIVDAFSPLAILRLARFDILGKIALHITQGNALDLATGGVLLQNFEVHRTLFQHAIAADVRPRFSAEAEWERSHLTKANPETSGTLFRSRMCRVRAKRTRRDLGMNGAVMFPGPGPGPGPIPVGHLVIPVQRRQVRCAQRSEAVEDQQVAVAIERIWKVHGNRFRRRSRDPNRPMLGLHWREPLTSIDRTYLGKRQQRLLLQPDWTFPNFGCVERVDSWNRVPN
ncbi:hypothetical protein KC325_g116 [Hortaea werneckii]|nr:hypothetical protein KC325_g116 [Hortaea werneckii]